MGGLRQRAAQPPWRAQGLCMVHAGAVHGACRGSAWRAQGLCMACAGAVHGVRRGSAWRMQGLRMEIAGAPTDPPRHAQRDEPFWCAHKTLLCMQGLSAAPCQGAPAAPCLRRS